eukprot:5387638-Prymnesium_polylepis.1
MWLCCAPCGPPGRPNEDVPPTSDETSSLKKPATQQVSRMQYALLVLNSVTLMATCIGDSMTTAWLPLYFVDNGASLAWSGYGAGLQYLGSYAGCIFAGKITQHMKNVLLTPLLLTIYAGGHALCGVCGAPLSGVSLGVINAIFRG